MLRMFGLACAFILLAVVLIGGGSLIGFQYHRATDRPAESAMNVIDRATGQDIPRGPTLSDPEVLSRFADLEEADEAIPGLVDEKIKAALVELQSELAENPPPRIAEEQFNMLIGKMDALTETFTNDERAAELEQLLETAQGQLATLQEQADGIENGLSTGSIPPDATPNQSVIVQSGGSQQGVSPSAGQRCGDGTGIIGDSGLCYYLNALAEQYQDCGRECQEGFAVLKVEQRIAAAAREAGMLPPLAMDGPTQLAQVGATYRPPPSPPVVADPMPPTGAPPWSVGAGKWGTARDTFTVGGAPSNWNFDGVSDPTKAATCQPPMRLVIDQNQCRKLSNGQVECKLACVP